MIIPGSGTSASGGSFAQGNFDPYIVGTGTFLLTIPGFTDTTVLSAGSFSSFKFLFGTGPDGTLGEGSITTHTTLPPPPVVPLPAAAWSGMLMLGGLGATRALKNRKAR
jgi:hypothetical protein